MDKLYAKQVLERLIAERSIHQDKFSGDPIHANCMPRFDKAIAGLEQEVGELQAARIDFSVSETALPDAIAEALPLKHAADALALENQHEAAEVMYKRARDVVAKEMNELDGFDR